MLTRCAIALLALLGIRALGQTITTLNLATQGHNADFSNFPSTKPMSVGSALPSTCQVGQLFFNTAAPAGANVFACNQPNTWVVLGSYTLPPAGFNTLGGVSVPNNSGLTVSSSGILSANVGTNSGALAAGNDSRIVNALQPTSLIPAANVTGLARSATLDTTNASNINSGILSSGLLPATISSSTTGNSATATAFSANPTGCPANQYATGISANGNAKCAQVGYSQVSGTPTLYDQNVQVGGTAQTPRANLNFVAGPNVTITPSDNGTNTTTLTLSGTAGVSKVAANGPINSTGGTIPTISCPTCATGATSFTNYALIVGQGAQALTALGSNGNTTQVLHGNASGLPAWGPVNLATDVTGQLPNSWIGGLAASATTDTTNASNISSGTLSAARLPNPTTSTLGGIESYAAAPHQWINSISTAGVPSSTQPAFSDISGSLNAAQLPGLTGDTTSSAGSNVTTTSKVNGTSVPTNSSPDQTIITSAAATGSWASLPSCLDSSGNHLNYNTTTHSFSCGNTGGTAASAAFGSVSSGTNTQAAMLVGTGASLAPAGSGTITANNYSGTLPSTSLPMPTGSTLGGIESYTAPLHQWINAVSTSGSASSSQPTASDITGLAASATTDTTNASNISSGTLNAERLPNPTSSTLGGIVSFAAVPHQWINSISTTGAPNSSQPAFTDISGVLATSQFPALTGDTSTSAGSTTTTTSRVNGTSVPINSSPDQTVVTTAPATGAWASLPSCLDTGGNHLNYNTSTHTFLCGSTSSSGGSGVGGSGSANVLPLFAGATTLGNSSLIENSTTGTITATKDFLCNSQRPCVDIVALGADPTGTIAADRYLQAAHDFFNGLNGGTITGCGTFLLTRPWVITNSSLKIESNCGVSGSRWGNAHTPSAPGGFVLTSNGSTYSIPSPTDAPNLTLTSGGSLASGTTYYVCYTLVNGYGETPCSPAATVTPSGTNLSIVVNQTDYESGGWGYNIYVSTAGDSTGCSGPGYSACYKQPQGNFLSGGGSSGSTTGPPFLSYRGNLGSTSGWPTLNAYSTGGTSAPLSNSSSHALVLMQIGLSGNGQTNANVAKGPELHGLTFKDPTNCSGGGCLGSGLVIVCADFTTLTNVTFDSFNAPGSSPPGGELQYETGGVALAALGSSTNFTDLRQVEFWNPTLAILNTAADTTTFGSDCNFSSGLVGACVDYAGGNMRVFGLHTASNPSNTLPIFAIRGSNAVGHYGGMFYMKIEGLTNAAPAVVMAAAHNVTLDLQCTGAGSTAASACVVLDSASYRNILRIANQTSEISFSDGSTIHYDPSSSNGGNVISDSIGTYNTGIKANTGTRYLCVDTTGKVVSQTSPCSGT